jgi:hypothetical protein
VYYTWLTDPDIQYLVAGLELSGCCMLLVDCCTCSVAAGGIEAVHCTALVAFAVIATLLSVIATLL